MPQMIDLWCLLRVNNGEVAIEELAGSIGLTIEHS